MYLQGQLTTETEDSQRLARQLTTARLVEEVQLSYSFHRFLIWDDIHLPLHIHDALSCRSKLAHMGEEHMASRFEIRHC